MGVVVAATHLAVHLLSREHRELARLFGSETGDRVDKFGRCDWWEGPAGLPILADAAAWFAGRVTGRFDLGELLGRKDPKALHITAALLCRASLVPDGGAPPPPEPLRADAAFAAESTLRQLVAEFDGAVSGEQYDAEGLGCLVQMPSANVDGFSLRLRDASRGRAVIQLDPG